MKIAIDARLYGLENAGIGRYVVNLVNGLEKVDRKNEYFILLRRKYFDSVKFENNNFHKVLADFSHYSFREQFLLPFLLYKLHCDLVHFPHFNVPVLYLGRQITTIHDLIKNYSRGEQTTTRRKSFYWFKYVFYRVLLWIQLKKTNIIITPSEWWKDKLIEMGLSGNKIKVTYEGVDKIYFSTGKFLSNDVLEKYRLRQPFLFYTGSLYPHKNVERLVSVIKILNKKIKISLAIACSRNVFFERFQKKILEMKATDCVELLGFVADEDLVRLYKKAEAFIFPSLLEGFGLPGLEAMACGLPVIASNSSCLPEIYGAAAIYFDPTKESEMVSKILALIASKDMREKMAKKGIDRAKQFSWDKMVRQTIEIYELLSSESK